MPTLEVIATGFNVKKLDPEAYGITQRFHTLPMSACSTGPTIGALLRLCLTHLRVCTMKVKLGDVEKTSTELRGLDGQWEEDQNKFTFEVSDPEKEQLEAWFIMGGVTLGVVATFNLNNLKKNVGTYKGVVCNIAAMLCCCHQVACVTSLSAVEAERSAG